MGYQTVTSKEETESKLLSFNDSEYDLILDLVQTYLDKCQGHDTIAFKQIYRKLLYNAKGLCI